MRLILQLFALFIFLLVLVLATTEVHATSLDIHITSKHANTNKEYNGNNFGLGITKRGYSAGFYKNSQYRWSKYVFKHTSKETAIGHIGVMYGGVTGYKLKIAPVLLPYFSIGKGKTRAVIGVLPTVVTFSMKFRFAD